MLPRVAITTPRLKPKYSIRHRVVLASFMLFPSVLAIVPRHYPIGSLLVTRLSIPLVRVPFRGALSVRPTIVLPRMDDR